MKTQPRHIGRVAIACALLYCGPAFAQGATDFQAEQFEPLAGQRNNVLSVSSSEVVPHFRPAAGLFFHYADDPLQLVDQDGDVDTRVVSGKLNAELWGVIGLYDFADIGLTIPVVLAQSGDDLAELGRAGTEVPTAALSDFRLTPKLRAPLPEDLGVGLALVAPLYLPTGDTESFNGEGTVRWEPRLVVDYSHDSGALLAANFGVQLRSPKRTRNFVSDDVLRWGFGAELPLAFGSRPLGFHEITGQASLIGTIQLADDVDPIDPSALAEEGVGSPMELLFGVRLGLPHDIYTNAGLGFGLNQDVGSPDARFFLGFGWEPASGDSDGDGIPDDADSCPQTPEDPDGFEDGNGCPDPDNDGDNIDDGADGCPNDAEDVDNFDDTDGCPDLDNDRDGIPDLEDKCPDIAGIAEQNGCPPPNDPDGDGIVGDADGCPNQPEDVDSFQDGDGCPDPDNDGDGVLDEQDKCKNEPETINQFEDEDGCPDTAPRVVVTKERIQINEKVEFETSRAAIRSESYGLLDDVAKVIAAHPQITKIRVDGHTDSRGSSKKNLELSYNRAKAVRDYLINKGVPVSKLQFTGHGEDKPIAENETKEGRAKNRRVEFVILEVNGQPVEDGAAVIEKRETIK